MNFSVLKNIFIVVFFTSIASLLYSNSLEAPFVFDDTQNIKRNTSLRINKITIDTLGKAVFEIETNSLRPIPRITFALNYYYHQYRLKGYHLVNTFIHIVSSITLYFFIKTTLSIPSMRARYNHPDAIAFFSTLIWLVHPLHTQSVTYIVQRMNCMSAMFYLLSILFYTTGRIRQKRQSLLDTQVKKIRNLRFSLNSLYFSGTVLFWLLALGSKENAAVLPIFIFLYEWYFFQDLSRKWLLQNLKIIFAAITILCLTALLFLGTNPLDELQSISDFANNKFTFLERVLTQPRVVMHYVSLIFYPHPSRLNIDYDFPLSHSLIDPATTLFSFLGILALFALAVLLAKKNPLFSFCILWFLGNLVVESSVIPLAIIYEHRTYLPSMLICLLVITLTQQYIKPSWTRVALLCTIAVIFSFWTYQRNAVWSDAVTLWSDCAAKSPNKPRPNYNLGLALKNQGRLEEAIKQYKETIRIQPTYVKAHYNIANTLREQNRFDEAIKHYEEAVFLRKDFAQAHYNLGVALQEYNRLDDAIKQYKEALRIKPDLEEAHHNIGLTLQKKGNSNEAIKHYKEALRIKPDLVKTHYSLGNIFKKQRRFDEAMKHYKAILHIKSEHVGAHISLGNVSLQLGHVDHAIKYYKKALGIQPDLKEAYNNLGNALQDKQRFDEAIKHYKMALKIDPDYTSAKNNLKNVLAKQKR